MDRSLSPKKKLKSPGIDATVNLNLKTSVTCVNVPEGLFEAGSAEKHFTKFGKVLKIRLIPRKRMCIIEYDQPVSAERAVLNAGAYDGFMFDVTRTKPKRRRSSRKEDDPDWLPDPDVEEELSAMSGAPTYRFTRQKPIDVDTSRQVSSVKTIKRVIKQTPVKPRLPVREKKPISAQSSGIESPVVITASQSSMSTSEAAAELNQLRYKVCLAPDEQWRILDARDRILRAWGGAGSRLQIGGATIGTCPDMCPEKELLHRQAEHQVMTLETVPGSDGELEPWRAVKQYSRSSADQEIPMCYELRPAKVLMRTCAYLLHEIADTQRQVSLADWFHFMWDRLRGIRKDITQQALCCAESIRLVEMCARFHAHCAARLADLEHTQFDQKLNTDNLTKCLQTLKHMYADVEPEVKPCEAEFRGYIALLNLGDANFWWEIKQLPLAIQKSEGIMFAIKVFNALDNNNYVRFFRLVKENATYLQACILLRYFNDVRARALARIVKAYAPRGGSRFPAQDLMSSLAFESVESMKSFINHYGLRFGKDQSELSVILDRNQFIEDSDPYPIARAVHLIETKRKATVGEVIAGGQLPNYDYQNHTLYTSFSKDGRLKEAALTAEEQGYNTINDSNKDVAALKDEIQRLDKGGKLFVNTERNLEQTQSINKSNLFMKSDNQGLSSARSMNSLPAPIKMNGETNLFAFKPAIPIEPAEMEKKIATSPKDIFSFSEPRTITSNNLSSFGSGRNLFGAKSATSESLFGRKSNENRDPFPNVQTVLKKTDEFVFKTTESTKTVFGQPVTENKEKESKNIFTSVAKNNLFARKDDLPTAANVFGGQNIFGKLNDGVFSNKVDKSESIFAKAAQETETPKASNIFAQAAATQSDAKAPSNIFGSFNKATSNNELSSNADSKTKSLFASNGGSNNNLSPSSLFKSAISGESKTYSIFQSKNKTPSVADNTINAVNNTEGTIYNFNQNQDDSERLLHEQRMKEEHERKLRQEEERKRQEEIKRREEERRQEEERRRKEEERKRQEEIKRLEEKRKKEEELKKKLEEERKAELKRKAEEEDRKFKERVENESKELVEELVQEVRDETVKEILSKEVEEMKILMAFADSVTEKLWTEVCDEISKSEVKAEKFWTDKLTQKWFGIWRNQVIKKLKQRSLLEDTPVWLPNKTPTEEAACLRRFIEKAALRHMNAIHGGYKFSGELKMLPSPEPYNLMEIIKSPLLKRLKQIGYPYDKCFFWKVTLVSPSKSKWLCKRINVEKWLLDAFSDNKQHEISESLIHVGQQSWNNLMDFAISVSLTNNEDKNITSEAIEGTNSVLFYSTENDPHFTKTIQDTLNQKYPYQIIPVAVIMPQTKDPSLYDRVVQTLTDMVNEKIVSSFKIFLLDSQNIYDSLNLCTKSALQWLTKNYPELPPLETDHVKSLCQRYLGNEIWYRLKSIRDCRMKDILKDLPKLVHCYNTAVDKLTQVITNEDLFNFPQFPLEFKDYLDHTTPYPKPYEFISTSSRNANNTLAITDTMSKLKLPEDKGSLQFQPTDVPTMQSQIRKYCNQIGWFENPEEVTCKVVAVLPNQFSDVDLSYEQFGQFFEQYDLVDILNIVVYEKICKLNNFDNTFAVYERAALENYRDFHWLYETEVLTKMKHKHEVSDDGDEIDNYIEAKRRKIAAESMEYLILVDNDCTMVEENIREADRSISKYKDCKEALKQLEEQIDLERQKSIELEKLLKSALSDV